MDKKAPTSPRALPNSLAFVYFESINAREFDMYKPRHIEKILKLAAQYLSVILITGARQVGKSTLLKNTYPEIPMITFDPIEDVLSARKEPQLFLKEHKPPLILDEIQYSPELLPVIKRLVDENKQYPSYFMTGSQNLSMLKNVAESMAGRVSIINLGPMTIYEQTNRIAESYWLKHYLNDPETLRSHITGTITEKNLSEVIWRGGMPGFIELPNALISNQFSSYLKTYVERDVRIMGEIQNIKNFADFLAIAAALTGQEINYNQLGREIGFAGPMAKKWLGIMINSYQWQTIPAYDGNTIKRVTLKPKGYFTDTGFVCYLQQISSPSAVLAHPFRGALFETLVANTIRSLLDGLGLKAKLYHWRADGGGEVDLIISLDGKLYPIEFKMSHSLNGHDTRGLRAFREEYHSETTPVMKGLIIYAGDVCYSLDEHTLAVPWNCTAWE